MNFSTKLILFVGLALGKFPTVIEDALSDKPAFLENSDTHSVGASIFSSSLDAAPALL